MPYLKSYGRFAASPMKSFLRGLYHSFPVQLVMLHFKKFQVLLLFWFLMFSTVGGTFMHSYGADSLFLAPEYLGNVNAVSAAIMGVAIGVLTLPPAAFVVFAFFGIVTSSVWTIGYLSQAEQ